MFNLMELQINVKTHLWCLWESLEVRLRRNTLNVDMSCLGVGARTEKRRKWAKRQDSSLSASWLWTQFLPQNLLTVMDCSPSASPNEPFLHEVATVGYLVSATRKVANTVMLASLSFSLFKQSPSTVATPTAVLVIGANHNPNSLYEKSQG